jgi:protein gp37
MATTSNIEWTEITWNPVTGCTKVSDGCKHCYANVMAKRLEAMKSPRYSNGFNVTLHHDLIDLPLKWKKPKIIFVNSMSDLFHKDVPFEFIREVFKTMQSASQHTFQILTKRSERLLELSSDLPWPSNVWQGVSIENESTLSRIDHLKKVPAAVRFLSLEPLLGPLKALDVNGIHWVIVGGESGPGARPMKEDWVNEIQQKCVAAGVPFFFKQWGGVQKHKNGRLLQGRTWSEYPDTNNL